MRGEHARNIAREAGYLVIPVDAVGMVRECAGVLEVGPGASPDTIATIAIRRQLHQIDVFDETRTRALVTEFGFAYVPQAEELGSIRSSGVRYRAVC